MAIDNFSAVDGRHRYFYSGLLIACDWPIDQWAAFEQPASAPADLTIRYGEPDFQCDAEDDVHEVPTVGRFVLRGGREIVVIREGDVDQRQINMFLTASAWGGLCYQRGLHLLHGSAIRFRGEAFAFAGHSGAGKSTLAAWLAGRGYETICDDTGRLEAVSGRVDLYPSARRLKLWGETMQALGWKKEASELETPDSDKFQIPMPGPAVVDPLPLGAVYLIGWGDLGLQRLMGAEAVRAFLESATYRPEFLDLPGRKQAFIQDAIQIVARVPVYRLTRPQDLTTMDDTIELLERHWNDEYPQTPKDPQRDPSETCRGLIGN